VEYNSEKSITKRNSAITHGKNCGNDKSRGYRCTSDELPSAGGGQNTRGKFLSTAKKPSVIYRWLHHEQFVDKYHFNKKLFFSIYPWLNHQ
jgi:hypothetical protein